MLIKLSPWGGSVRIGRGPTIKQMDFPDKWAAIVWMCRNQLGRRNITDEQKTALIGEAYKAQKMTAGGDRRSDNFSKGQNGLLKKYENTAQKIADDFGVGEQTVKRAEHFIDSLNEAEKVSPGIKAAHMAFKAESRGHSPASCSSMQSRT